MSRVTANMSMSVDGFVEDRDGGVGPLFGWYASGDVAVEMPGDQRGFRGVRSATFVTADVARQCLDLGLLDKIHIDLVPVILGVGRPFFAGLAEPARLGDPVVVEGRSVTHLRHEVRR